VKQGQWEFDLETKFCNKKHGEVQTLQEFVLMHRIGRFATDVRREEEGRGKDFFTHIKEINTIRAKVWKINCERSSMWPLRVIVSCVRERWKLGPIVNRGGA
jgi:hypothetical protein